MEYGFFQTHFQSKGIETVVPSEPSCHELDRIIWEELSHCTINSDSQAAACSMIKALSEDGCEAIVLACTELSLLINSSRPLYDTTHLHALAIQIFPSANQPRRYDSQSSKACHEVFPRIARWMDSLSNDLQFSPLLNTFARKLSHRTEEAK
jgi:hypothetical protein